MSELICEVKGEIDAAIVEYLAELKRDIELLTAPFPEIFGKPREAKLSGR